MFDPGESRGVCESDESVESVEISRESVVTSVWVQFEDVLEHRGYASLNVVISPSC